MCVAYAELSLTNKLHISLLAATYAIAVYYSYQRM
jgi:hypothetical protein